MTDKYNLGQLELKQVRDSINQIIIGVNGKGNKKYLLRIELDIWHEKQGICKPKQVLRT